MIEVETEDCIVVRTACCKRIVYAAVNIPRVVDAKAKRRIGSMVAKGCTVEHMSAEQVRKSDFGCKCNQPQPRKDT